MSCSYSAQGDVAVLQIDNPPVNALSMLTRVQLREGLEKGISSSEIAAIIVTGTERTFIGGADIKEFGTADSLAEPSLAALIDLIENSPKPVIAFIQGTALGGGLEIALGCQMRVASADARLGLPEVALGIMPGAGGTQRTPRLTGVAFALDMMTSGRHVTAQAARDAGLVDAIVDNGLDSALAFVRQHVVGQTLAPRPNKAAGTDPAVFAEARARLKKSARGAEAPFAIVDCVERACTASLAEGLAYEQERFFNLYEGPQHAALKYYFFAERAARKISDHDGVTASPALPGSVAVIGSGTMGCGIAKAFANAGVEVRLIDINEQALQRGAESIRKGYAHSVGRGSISEAKAAAAINKISYHADNDILSDVDLVIEAVFEDMELKKRIFSDIDKRVKSSAILATNTSSLNIDEIAEVTSRPERVVGLHFFSPADVMRLLEIVRSKYVSNDILSYALKIGSLLKKVTVVAGNCDGFLANRTLGLYGDAADFLVEAGASPQQIDNAAVAFGMPMGPYTMLDMAGLDTAVALRKARWAANASGVAGSGDRISPLIEKMFAAGRLGQKNGKGFYAYQDRKPLPDPEADAIVAEIRKEQGRAPRSFTDEEIIDHLFMPVVNEGFKELEEGIAYRASDIDVAWVNGYGFPAHKGGPMYWGQLRGLGKIRDMAEANASQNGPRWQAAKLLDTMIAEEKK